jgi:ubiquinone biosynthesis protein UbiJ
MTDTPLAEHIREIVRTELAPMRAQLDGLPLINRTATAIQQLVRSLRGAFHDFALTNPTSGEIEALHTDVNRVQAENAELAARVMTLERLVRELGERKS